MNFDSIFVHDFGQLSLFADFATRVPGQSGAPRSSGPSFAPPPTLSSPSSHKLRIKIISIFEYLRGSLPLRPNAAFPAPGRRSTLFPHPQPTLALLRLPPTPPPPLPHPTPHTQAALGPSNSGVLPKPWSDLRNRNRVGIRVNFQKLDTESLKKYKRFFKVRDAFVEIGDT